MTYQVLARKWRPQQFSEMIGQEHVLRALVNALDTQRLHHAYLFTGMRGVGKTTIARVFAKSLNCETNGVSSTPCGECSTCRDIEAGSYIDLIEVDAASRTGVDDTRELLENVPYAPASGRFKVYLIDEVHMFSKSAFNALLKTLEEPPEHVKFLLATTDPEKVLVTILSRCLQFNLKSVPSSVLCDYLGQLLDQEKIKWEPTALSHIAEAAEGSVRDSLSLVEQAAAFGQGSVTAADVESMLGRLSPSRVIDLLEAVGAGDAASVLSQINALAEYGPDYAQLLASVLSTLHQIAMIQAVPDSLGDTVVNRERLEHLAGKISAEDAQLYYQIGLLGRRDMPHAPDQRAALEMVLLRMLSFRPLTPRPGSGTGSGGIAVDVEAATQPATQPATQASASGISSTSSVPPDQPPTQSSGQSSGQQHAPASQAQASDGALLGQRNQPTTTAVNSSDQPVSEAKSRPIDDGANDASSRTGNAAANAARMAMIEAALAATPDSPHPQDVSIPSSTPAVATKVQTPTAVGAAQNPPTQGHDTARVIEEGGVIKPDPADERSMSQDASQQDSVDVPDKRTGQTLTQNPAQSSEQANGVSHLQPSDEPGPVRHACQETNKSAIVEDCVHSSTDEQLEPSTGNTVGVTEQLNKESLLSDSFWHAGNWLHISDLLGLEGMPGQLLNQCAFESLQNNVLSLQMESEFAHLMSDQFVRKVQDTISEIRRAETSVSINLVEIPIDSPASIKAKNQELALQAARLSIQQDPLVKELIEKVDGVVDENSVRPVQ